MTRQEPDDSLSEAEKRCITPTKAVPDVPYLVVHAVHPVRPQQVNGLADEIRASAVEHPKTQIEMELVRGGLGVETLEGAEATFGPDDHTRQQHQPLVTAGGQGQDFTFTCFKQKSHQSANCVLLQFLILPRKQRSKNILHRVKSLM